jgi:hypothetical protein
MIQPFSGDDYGDDYGWSDRAWPLQFAETSTLVSSTTFMPCSWPGGCP